MREGRIVQSGPPSTVYREPATAWVAGFVGEAVLLPATVDGPVALTPLGRVPLHGTAAGGAVTVLLRPEQMRVAANGDGTVATVVRHDFHGHDALVLLRLPDGSQVTARVLDSTPPFAVGETVTVSVRGAARAFPSS
ncbi:MAG: TOBE domain-containing protein, partial [Actinomycetes bacterium]